MVAVNRVDRPQLGWKRPPEWDRFLEAVADRDVLADAGLTDDTPARDAGSTDANPGVEPEDTGTTDLESDVDARMDALTDPDAHARADGGGEE